MIQFKEFDESRSREKWPDLTPLLDMVFLLLIFFLLTSFLSRPAVPVSLPEAENAEPRSGDVAVITVLKDGSILLNGVPTTEDDLPDALREAEGFSVSGEVIIQADKEVPFGKVVGIMDGSKRGGAKSLSFLVEWRQ